MRRRSASPPGRSNRASSLRPYLTVSTCQPAASNIPARRPKAMSGTTRSSDWRFRSTTQSTSPRRATHGSAIASQTAPSSSSASPSSAIWRPRGGSLEAVVLEVPARDRAPDRRGRADADGAGRVVDRVGVLRPARVALEPAERAQRLEVGLLEPAEQVVDRVQDRRGVRLHRDLVLRAQLREPERGHQAHHRGARRLVAADLHPGAVLAHAIRVVDDRGGEPEHPPLYGLERL